MTKPSNSSSQLATFAGGCFWCTEAIFKRVKGVLEVTSGYTGGEVENPSYEKVSSGNTGHAEAVQIKFDPTIISYDHLLDIFWATHDPTTVNQQGADVGTQYRSSIFYHDQTQKKAAEASMKQLSDSGKLSSRVVTKIEPYKKFFTAESYHQDYYDSFKDINPYCSIVIDPKIEKLLNSFNADVKEEYK